jgi:protein-tyrosine phosphatase
MKAELYRIPETNAGQLSVMPRPRGDEWLEDEIKSLRQAGVDIIVSLLTEGEITELGLTDESSLCENQHIEYMAFPIADRQVPTSFAAFTRLAHTLGASLQQGKSVAIHCRAGIGRSATLAACILVLQGLSVTDAFQAIERARGVPVPDTIEQRNWVAQFARQ